MSALRLARAVNRRTPDLKLAAPTTGSRRAVAEGGSGLAPEGVPASGRHRGTDRGHRIVPWIGREEAVVEAISRGRPGAAGQERSRIPPNMGVVRNRDSERPGRVTPSPARFFIWMRLISGFRVARGGRSDAGVEADLGDCAR